MGLLREMGVCRHAKWRRFDIGFDQGLACANCKQEVGATCHCGREAAWAAGEANFELWCLSGRCEFRRLVPRGDVQS